MTVHPDGVPEITPTELKKRLDAGDVPVLVDVRERFERRIADLPDHRQIRIPPAEIFTRLGELDRNDEIVLYCRSGARSAWAAQLMRQRGYARVWNLKGGLLRWREEVDPSLRSY